MAHEAVVAAPVHVRRRRMRALGSWPLVIGIGLSWFGGRATGHPVPADIANRLAPNGTPLATDAAIAPRITAIYDHGDSVDLAWVDHSGGGATFLVTEGVGAAGSPVRLVDAGQTGVTLAGLDPAARQYCFQVVAFTGTARGDSPVGCTPVRH